MKPNYKAIILLLITNTTSGFAQGLTIIAIPWYFTDTINASSTFTFLYAILAFLGLFWGLYGFYFIFLIMIRMLTKI